MFSLDWMAFFGLFAKVVLPFLALAIMVELVKSIPRWILEIRTRAAGIDKVDSMTGKDFEIWLAHQFKTAGYDVRRTPYQGDHGADLIIISPKGTSIAIQAKKLSKRKDRVGAKALGEVLRGKKYYNCDGAMMVTNQGYTQQAKDEAKRIGIILFDREKLIAFVEKIKRKSKNL